MKRRFLGFVVGLGMFLVCFSCSRKSENAPVMVLLGTDTISSVRMLEVTPDSALTDSQRWSNALYRIALSQRQNIADSAESRQLADQLELRTNIYWSTPAAQMLLSASRVCVSSIQTRGIQGTLAFCDSLIGANVKEHHFPIVTRSGRALFDTLLGEKKILSPLLGCILGLSDEAAFIVADFARADTTNSTQMLSAGNMVQGLVFSSSAQKGKIPKAATSAVRIDTKTSDGLKFRNQQSITASIGAHAQSIQGIYKKYLKVNESMAGAVWIQFSVNPDGSVANAEIRQTDIADPAFSRELLEYVRTISFAQTPVSVGSMRFVFPFNFTAE